MTNCKFAYFGTPHFAVDVLEELKTHNLLPSLIVTAPDKKAGRGMKMTPPAVKVWAQENNIPYIQPKSLKEIPQELTKDFDVFIVAAYGKILKKKLIELPRTGTINVHPSLLPHYRGASPIEGQILQDEKHVGVTIMQMDEELDHGPIIEALEVALPSWPVRKDELARVLAERGGQILSDILPKWCAGEIVSREQEHKEATFTTKIEKQHGEIDFRNAPYKNYLTFCAYHPWPGTFFFLTDGTRIKIIDATYHDNIFLPTKVVPEGKKEVRYSELPSHLLPPEAPKQ